MFSTPNHPQRFALANEMHARPFPELRAPARVAFLALKNADDTKTSDRAADRARLVDLLDRYGAPHPQPEATHYTGQLGQYQLKWEQHTEFQTYSLFLEGSDTHPFDSDIFDFFPTEWGQENGTEAGDADCVRITSALITILPAGSENSTETFIRAHFVPESLCIARVLDNSAIIATDFRIDPKGHVRIAILPHKTTGPQRIGRIVQRLSEIETYKTMSMLGFSRARDVSPTLNHIEQTLSGLMGDMRQPDLDAEKTLNALLAVSAELEHLTAALTFRFGASAAYEAIVLQRIEVLREDRFRSRQTFYEFMLRRYDPAMRTIRSTRSRLDEMTQAAARAGDLLRTRVDVDRSAQNQHLLRSMDARADQQLKLQRTVEGLSVVAISYYAVSLLSYVVYPFFSGGPIGKGMVMAGLTPLVVLAVWIMQRRLTRH